MNSRLRIGLALILGFFIGLGISLANGQDFLSALQGGLYLALIVGVIVAFLSWGMDMAVKKGYPSWLGFLLAFCLNIIGLIILALLPSRTQTFNSTL